MAEDFNSRIWWDSVTGPKNLIETIVLSLRKKKTVLLHVPEDLPWRKQMRSSSEYSLKQIETELLIHYIDCLDECPDLTNIAGYLMDRFAPADVQNEYRASSGLSIQQYMLKKEVLKNRVFWVKGIDTGQIKNWYEFCKKYQATNIDDGLFVIETYDHFTSRNMPSHMETINYDAHVSYYDALLFNSMVVANLALQPQWKQYIAAVVSSLCQRDVELSERFIAATDFTQDDPVERLRDIATSERFANRMQASNLAKTHPFFLIRNHNNHELNRRVWQAQLQSVYSLLEIERIDFIAKYKQELQEVLNTVHLDSRNSRIANVDLTYNVFDLEIGNLDFLTRQRRNPNSYEYLLYIPEDGDRKRLQLLRHIRNYLAHMEPCTPREINVLISGFPYFR